MRNLENRIIRLEQHTGNHLVNMFYELTCRSASEQNKPKPEKPRDVAESMKQLFDYLPN